MKKKLMALMLCVVFALTGCMAGMKAAEMWKAASPKSKAVFFVETYNDQFDQYVSIVGMATGLTPSQVMLMMDTDPAGLQAKLDSSNLSDDARAVLKYKKDLLVQLSEPIDVFAALAQAGLEPTPEQERVIINLLNKHKYKAYMM